MCMCSVPRSPPLDDAAGGYRMLSLADATGRRTAACALRNCLYLFPLGALATWLGVTSPYFAYESGEKGGGCGQPRRRHVCAQPATQP